MPQKSYGEKWNCQANEQKNTSSLQIQGKRMFCFLIHFYTRYPSNILQISLQCSINNFELINNDLILLIVIMAFIDNVVHTILAAFTIVHFEG